MKTKYTTCTDTNIKSVSTLCLDSYRKLLAKISEVRDDIFREFADTTEAHAHLLHLALNEAEAIAWQTQFPHLLFPTLATEKAQAIAEWYARQKSIRHSEPVLAFAA